MQPNQPIPVTEPDVVHPPTPIEDRSPTRVLTCRNRVPTS